MDEMAAFLQEIEIGPIAWIALRVLLILLGAWIAAKIVNPADLETEGPHCRL